MFSVFRDVFIRRRLKKTSNKKNTQHRTNFPIRTVVKTSLQRDNGRKLMAKPDLKRRQVLPTGGTGKSRSIFSTINARQEGSWYWPQSAWLFEALSPSGQFTYTRVAWKVLQATDSCKVREGIPFRFPPHHAQFMKGGSTSTLAFSEHNGAICRWRGHLSLSRSLLFISTGLG